MEVWLTIDRFPNHQVSSYGRVRNRNTGYVLKPFPDRYGYLRLSIGPVNNVYIHRLVCEAFHGKPIGNRNQVNHIDCDRQNNCADNLEWCTASENISWGVSHGNLDPTIGLVKAREANLKQVRIVETNQIFNSVKDCADYLKVNPNRVSRCLVGVRKGQRLHGYHLEYV